MTPLDVSVTPWAVKILSICCACSAPLRDAGGPLCGACAAVAVPVELESHAHGKSLAGNCPWGCGESYWIRVNGHEIECVGCGRRALPATMP